MTHDLNMILQLLPEDDHLLLAKSTEIRVLEICYLTSIIYCYPITMSHFLTLTLAYVNLRDM